MFRSSGVNGAARLPATGLTEATAGLLPCALEAEAGMDLKLFFMVFGTVLLAELGDKTQLATFLFAADGNAKWTVFAGAALALVASSAIAVAAAGLIAQWVDERLLGYAAGTLFVVIGAVTLYQTARG